MGIRYMRLFEKLLGACFAVSLCVAIAPVAPKAETAIAHGTRLELAQNYGAPPGDVGEDAPYGGQPQDSSLLVRIDRLESQMRQINGQIEQLQFQNRKLEEQLKKFQEDVDFRFQDNGRAPSSTAPSKPLQKRGDAIDNLIDSDDTPSAPGAAPSGAATSSRMARRGDAFDPSEDPNAPGIPRALGNQSAPAYPSGAAGGRAPQMPARSDAGFDSSDPNAPLDLSGGRLRAQGAQGAPASAVNPRSATPSNGAADAPVAALTTPNGVAPGAAPINPVKEEFDVAFGYFRQKEYENAERSFSAFIQKNPKSKLASEATYYLGESFFQRGRQREAAEQYLKISTQYASSSRAPDAMLRLGQSLNALGAKEQACATFGEIARKYPNASATVKAGADREAKRAQC
jgi:tol-pal system protein YbgF